MVFENVDVEAVAQRHGRRGLLIERGAIDYALIVDREMRRRAVR